MMIDWTISVGSIVQVIGMIVGGLIVLVTLKNTVSELQKDVSAVQFELRQMSSILTKMAVAETRLDNSDTRLSRVESDVRELRHGQGFVRGATGIDREYTG